MSNRTLISGPLPSKPNGVPRRRLDRAVSTSRDRIQSELLTGAIGMLLAAKLAIILYTMRAESLLTHWVWVYSAISLAFAIVVVLLRSATRPAAVLGGLVCMHVLVHQDSGFDWQDSAMLPLLALFFLTYAATHYGRLRKEALGVAEQRSGRRASQVVANLGAAGLLASGGTPGSQISYLMLAACVAALAEATADTVSSEMGQALAGSRLGNTIMITSGRRVPPGTDGGISLAGTALGILAAALVVMVSPFAYTLGAALCILAAAIAGLLFDSLLGATVERNGWLGNDLVNFTSTVFAASIAWAALIRL